MAHSNITQIEIKNNVLVEKFKVGDLVAPYYAPMGDFYGVVIDVNPKEEKVYVDYNGTIRQQDPDEIRVVLYQRIMNQLAPNKIASITNKIVATDTIAQLQEFQTMFDNKDFLALQSALEKKFGINSRQWNDIITKYNQNKNLSFVDLLVKSNTIIASSMSNIHQIVVEVVDELLDEKGITNLTEINIKLKEQNHKINLNDVKQIVIDFFMIKNNNVYLPIN